MRAFEEIPSRQVRLADATINYRELGQGPPIVFVHGLLSNGTLWRKVAERLQTSHRCIVPDWPLGAHTAPVRPGADLSPCGLARMVAGFLDVLGLQDVTLVANDTGGAIAQMVATEHPGRLGRLVLTPCDAFDNFLPPMFRPLQYTAKVPGALYVAVQALRAHPLRRLPMTYGLLAKRPIPDHIVDGWLRPAQTRHATRRDTARFLRAIGTAHTLDAAARLSSFRRPVLLAWATEDRVFPFEHARRLAAILPRATIAPIADSYGFVPEDQPERLAELIRDFVNATNPATRHERQETS
ncbi:alpha/beta fold hydrolase [Actinomadura rudentiformis]|uniref:Alpha/beta hydrolase n=1 Tax=Actinomadura rudentiformis TaxID=359158 RepID=A0A6H9Y6M6_9ACTN|nr:alpha/beta hydrolase [Actinomadura rudentiformis]KAB2339303.1 alpha/beta hydrolase [Actinomadura rudentiformis]